MKYLLHKLLILFLLFIFKPGLFAQTPSASLVWGDEGTQTIGLYNILTEDVDILKKGPGKLNFTQAIAVDSTSGTVFFVTNNELRAGTPETNGAEVLHVFDSSSGSYIQLTLDTETNALFLTNWEHQLIYKYDLSTNSMDSILTAQDGLDSPMGVATHNGEIYWTDNGSIFKAQQDGSDIETAVENAGNIIELLIDHNNEWIYGRNSANKQIKRFRADGTDEEVVVSQMQYPPVAMALDSRNEHFYWMYYDGTLNRTDLDGSNSEEVMEVPGTFSKVSSMEFNPNDERFYWVYDESTIEKQAPADSVKISVFNEFTPTSVDFDMREDKIFWMDNSQKVVSVYDIDSDTETEIANLQFGNNLMQLAIDTIANRVFFGVPEGIISMDYDGSNSDTLDVNHAGSFSGIAIDAENEIIYYTDNGSTSFGNLKKVKYNGSEQEELLSFELNYSRALTFDSDNEALYWTSGFGNDMSIEKTNTTSPDVETVLTAGEHGLQSPLGISLDPLNEHIYWSDSETNTIERTNYDGSGKITVISNGLDTPRNLAVFVNQVITTTEELTEQPGGIKLHQNYPNPFNPSTSIPFELDKAQKVSLTVYNLLGKKIKTLVSEQRFQAGFHEINFDAHTLASGIYFYRLNTPARSYQRKLTLIK